MSKKATTKDRTEQILYSIAAFFLFSLLFLVYYLQLHTLWLYILAQILYFLAFVMMFYFLTTKINWVRSSEAKLVTPGKEPLIIMAYPVLREDEDTMRSTMTALDKIDYLRDRYKVVAIPNFDDTQTIAILERLQSQFAFLEKMEVPPTSDPSWNSVWDEWDKNPKVYWWHQGKYKKNRELPPKKTRQLIYFLYNLKEKYGRDWVLCYIDADTIVPTNHFRIAAAGLQKYDVLQATTITGNLFDTYSTRMHGWDHMTWDPLIYPHMSANGKHPYYVLGKGNYFRAKDLYDLGGFNPWTAIEDPEVGIRFWVNGKRLGIIEQPVFEEVPQNFIKDGIVQRNRWMCGFFQTMAGPLKAMGLKFWQRQQARLNLGPVLSLPINIIGIPTGIYIAYLVVTGQNPLPLWLVILTTINIIFYVALMSKVYTTVWKHTRYRLDKTSDRLSYMFTINPLMLFVYWILWTIPIVGGFFLYITDKGKAWERTEKADRDKPIIESQRFLLDLQCIDTHIENTPESTYSGKS